MEQRDIVFQQHLCPLAVTGQGQVTGLVKETPILINGNSATKGLDGHSVLKQVPFC